jgi:hypothetical protein
MWCSGEAGERMGRSSHGGGGRRSGGGGDWLGEIEGVQGWICPIRVRFEREKST